MLLVVIPITHLDQALGDKDGAEVSWLAGTHEVTDFVHHVLVGARNTFIEALILRTHQTPPSYATTP